ncbi:MAG TPA: hypothetical protein VIY50_05515 [Steroidobacteraceae bacterium]
MATCLLFGASLLAVAAGVSSRADESVPPLNAHASRYGGWECSRGFSQVGEACVPVKVPENAYLDSFGTDWDCNRGYVKDDQDLGCKAVRIPANAHADDDQAYGTGWECDLRYHEVSGRCARIVTPANAHYSELSFGRGWDCNPGYRQDGSICMPVRAPAHGFLVGDQDDWVCDRGFVKSTASCVHVAVPANGYLNANGDDWRCERGYRQKGTTCARLVVPAGAYIDYTGNGWTCGEGLHEQAGVCAADGR